MLKLILIFWWKAKEFNLLVSVSGRLFEVLVYWGPIFLRYSQSWDVPYDAAWISTTSAAEWGPWSDYFYAGWCTTTFRECCSHLPGRNVYKLDRSQGDNWLAGTFSRPNTLWFRLMGYCKRSPETLTHCRHCDSTSEKKFKKSIGTSSSVKTFATWQRTGVWNVLVKKVNTLNI